MNDRHVCDLTHRHIQRGVCRWCQRWIDAGEPSAELETQVTEYTPVEWNLAAIEEDLRSGDQELRLHTASTLAEFTSSLAEALPLAAIALADGDPEVRTSAEHACHWLGSELTDEQVAWLESQRDAPDVARAVRTILLGSYSGPRKKANRAARATHIFWMIEHHPEALTTGLPDVLILKGGEPVAYEAARQLWHRQCEAHRTNASVQGNAARFFLINDRVLAEKYLHRAQQLEPENPKWHEDQAQLHMLAARHGPEEQRAERARKSMVELEMAEQLRSAHSGVRTDGKFNGEQLQQMSVMEQVHTLPRRARAALEAGELTFARQFALEALTLTSSDQVGEYFRNDGNAIHTCHMVLGHLALGEGKLDQARLHLIESGKTKGAPNLGSFGPNMSLAKELLARGEREVVLEYLELCGKFWEMGADRLAMWSEEIKRGEMPAFGTNLVY